MSRCVYMVARGAPALREAKGAIQTLREYHDWPVYLATDQGRGADGIAAGVTRIDLPEDVDPGGRWAKISLWSALDTDHDQALYLDADTRVYGDVSVGFEMLDAGWDMVITPSQSQDHDVMWHIREDERNYTAQRIGNALPLALQAGVFWVRRSDPVVRLFRAWCEEWSLFSDQDQASLLRAVNLIPIRIALLGCMFNGCLDNGKMVIGHRFGALARKAQT